MNVTNIPSVQELRSGYCGHCRQSVHLRRESRNVQLSRTRVWVRELPVDVCMDCDHTVSIPRESIPQLRQMGVA